MRPIDADALYEKLNEIGGCDAEPDTWARGWDDAIDAAISSLEQSPTIDSETIRQGKWFGTVCTACGESTSFYYDCDYCPKCGARMDEEDENDGEV